MPQKVSRASVAANARYLRKKNGQFNGSVGSGREPITAFGRRSQARQEARKAQLLSELSPRERKELTRVLRQKAHQPKPSNKVTSHLDERKQHQETIDRINKKPASQLTSADKFERKIAQTRLQQLDRKTVVNKPQQLTVTGDVVSGKLPKTLNPQNQTNRELLPQTLSNVKKTKLVVTKHGLELEVAYHPTTSVKLEKDFSYKVTHDGKEVLLNDNPLAIAHKGYTVKGVPNIVADFKETDHTTLVEKIALAEREVRKGRAPSWNTDEHGKIVGDSELVGKSSAAGGTDYRGMQIHHVGQWAKHTPTEIEADFKAGRIDSAERERRYLDTIEPNKYKDEKNNAEYMLKLKPQHEREFVVLPGGLHQGGTPLFTANHPAFYNPSTGKFGSIGIPKKGEGGREWFEREYRGSFWKEYAKVQLSELTHEVNNRIKKGKLTPEQVRKEYDRAVDRMGKGEIIW